MKLSPRFPKHQADNKARIERLNNLYLPTLKNLDISRPRLMILFSGLPCSGKSTIARDLEQVLGGVRLENDVIRILVSHEFPDLPEEERTVLTYAYMMHAWEHLADKTTNGLWIVDSSVDRRWRKICTFAERHKFATFLIAMNIPEAVHRQWILQRDDRPFNTAKTYLERMQQRRREQQQFLSAGPKPDLTLMPDYQINNIAPLVRARLDNLQD